MERSIASLTRSVEKGKDVSAKADGEDDADEAADAGDGMSAE